MEEQKDLTMLNKPVPKKHNGLLIVLLILFIACICVGSYLFGKSLNSSKNKETTEQKEEKKEEEATPKLPEKTLKERIIEETNKKLEEKGLYKPDLIEDRTIEVKKAGYYKDNPTLHYYTVYGKFKCKPGSNPANETTCLYQSQLGDPDEDGKYDYAFTLSIEKVDGELVLGEFTEPLADPNFVELDEEVD